jgi:hypothetical protein
MSRSASIPAFSIMEAVIGMVVMAVIMGIVFLIFSIISERMLDFKDQNQYVADLNRLTYSVNKDIFDHEQLMDAEGSFIFKAYSGDITEYRMHEEYVLRSKGTFIDTFKVPIRQKRCDTITGKGKRVVFQRLAIAIELNKQTKYLRFYKRVYANDLIKSIKE